MTGPPSGRRAQPQGAFVQDEIADPEPAPDFGTGRRSVAERAESQHHLLQAEGLADVVIAAVLQSRDPILDAGPGAEKQHRQSAGLFPQRTHHLEPVHIRQLDVEHHDVRGCLPGGPEGRCAVARRGHLPSFVPQRDGHQLADERLAVDDQGTYRCIAVVRVRPIRLGNADAPVG